MKPARSLAPAALNASITPAYIPTAADVDEYMPLVRQTVARFVRKLPPNVLRDDLMAAGTYGLIDSLRKNGQDRGPTFEWYARIRIRGAILDELRTQDWLTRRARNKVTAASDSSAPARAAVIGFDDLPERGRAISLTDENAQSPLQMCEKSIEKKALAKAMEQLPEREQMIVRLHYFQDVQFKAIAAKLGVSEPRVSQLHARAMGKLKALLDCDRAA
jgi:RNA polymerase sigma factor for flagellar operon FliA